MAYSEIYTCDFCLAKTEYPVKNGWLRLEPMGVFLNKPKQIDSVKHFCRIEHLGFFLDWWNGTMPPQEVEKIRNKTRELGNE